MAVILNGLQFTQGYPRAQSLDPYCFYCISMTYMKQYKYSELNIFVDNVALYKEIKSSADCDLLQVGLYNLVNSLATLS